MIGVNEKEQQLVNALEIGGIYEHYKSTIHKKMHYRVLGVVRHSENEQLMVVYEALYDCGNYGQMWARPLEMFLDEVKINDRHIARFTLIAESDCKKKSCC